jgi:hypothetical protein
MMIVTFVVVVYLLQRRNERTLADLTKRYFSAQELYSKAQREASQFRVQYEAASLQLGTADPDEKAKLRRHLEELKRTYNDSQSQANAYQRQLNSLRQDQGLVTSDRSALLNRIQDLQAQLNTVNADRDRLRYTQASSTALRTIAEDLQSQLNTVTAERVERPIFKVVPQFSLVHLSPFAGRVAIAVGDIHTDNAANLRVYIWTTDRNLPLPPAFRGDRKRSKRLLDRLDKGSCSADGASVPLCYRVRKIDVVMGHQLLGKFTLGSARYEILATAWNNDVSGQEDSLALALYPAAK